VEGVEFLWKLGAFLIAAGAVYGGIRSDLKEMHERIGRNEASIDRVNERLNSCMVCERRRRED
jgi:hypothetical protein